MENLVKDTGMPVSCGKSADVIKKRKEIEMDLNTFIRAQISSLIKQMTNIGKALTTAL